MPNSKEESWCAPCPAPGLQNWTDKAQAGTCATEANIQQDLLSSASMSLYIHSKSSRLNKGHGNVAHFYSNFSTKDSTSSAFILPAFYSVIRGVLVLS